MNNFHKVIKDAALEFARANALVMPGDIVETTWRGSGKKPRRVQIYSVGAALAAEDHYDPQKQEWPTRLEMTYCALRLRANGEPRDKPGCGIVLTEFTTEDGREWKRSRYTINHCAVHWNLPESWPYVPLKEGEAQ